MAVFAPRQLSVSFLVSEMKTEEFENCTRGFYMKI